MVNSFRALLLFLMLFISSTPFAAEPQVSLTLSNDNVWQRQQVLIHLEVITDDPFARLDSQEFERKGFTITAFEQQRSTEKSQTTLTMKWQVFPFVAGDYQLELPRIRYRPNSGRPEKLALAVVPLKVRRLPIYVPPTMPVGKVKLESSWDEGLLVSTKQLLDWNIKVTSTNVARQTMLPLSRQLKTTESIQILPLQQTFETQQLGHGIESQQLYQVPLKALDFGRLDLPPLEIQYFEPDSGKLQKAIVKPPFVIALSYWMQWVFVLFLTALLLLTMLKILPKLQFLYKNSSNRRQALQALKQARNYQQIRIALNQLAVTKSWKENITLDEFVRLWEKENSNDTRLKVLLESLKNLQFSINEGTEIKQIGEDLVKILR